MSTLIKDTETPALNVSNLSIHFTLKNKKTLVAVDDISFSVMAGKTLGIVGESGCGKTSLAKTILRLYQATSGKVEVNGVNWLDAKNAQAKQMRRNIQMVFQDPYASLDPRQSIGSAVMEPMRAANLFSSRTDLEDRCAWLLEHVGLSPTQMWRFPHEFSGGQLQRVGIARALALTPKVILADEPVSALDVSIRAQVLNLFRDLQREMKLALIFISHDLSLVRYMSQNIAVMYLGRIVEFGDAEEICSNPAHPYTQMLINSIPHPNPTHKLEFSNSACTDLPSPMNQPSGCVFHPRCPIAKDICREKVPKETQLSNGTKVRCLKHEVEYKSVFT